MLSLTKIASSWWSCNRCLAKAPQCDVITVCSAECLWYVLCSTSDDSNKEKEQSNPMVQLFYGQYMAEGVNEGQRSHISRTHIYACPALYCTEFVPRIVELMKWIQVWWLQYEVAMLSSCKMAFSKRNSHATYCKLFFSQEFRMRSISYLQRDQFFASILAIVRLQFKSPFQLT